MLKITIHPEAGDGRMKLEGRLAGPWVDELERCWREAAGSRQSSVVVDLSGVTFIDPEGKALLSKMWQQGVKLHASGCLTRCIVEEIMKTDREWKKIMKTECIGESPSSLKGKSKGN